MQNAIHFLNGNSPEIQDHYFEKGYRNDITIEISNLFYDVHFFTQNSLLYEMTGDGFFSLPGMIILEEITHEKILASINYLIKIKYFDFFEGEKNLTMYKKSLSNWYINGTIVFNKENLFSLRIA